MQRAVRAKYFSSFMSTILRTTACVVEARSQSFAIQARPSFEFKVVTSLLFAKFIGCEDCSDNVEHQCGKPTRFKCEMCKYSTKIKNNLKMHIEAKHEHLVRFACNSCDKKAYYKTNLH